MANDVFDDDPFEYIDIKEWGSNEKVMYTDVFEGDEAYDEYVAALYHEAYFNFDNNRDLKVAFRDRLDEYLLSAYGIDFQQDFDWETYREMYDASA